MTRRITASRQIDAAPAAIHRVVADYRDGHRRIVPPKAFLWLAVDKGGLGAGTEIRFAMRAFGKVRTTRAIVTSPIPDASWSRPTRTAATSRASPSIRRHTVPVPG